MKAFLTRHQKTLGVLALVVLVVLLTGMKETAFLSPIKLTNLAKWTGLYGILAIGVAFVIITGGIDLSIGSLVGLTGVLLPFLLVDHGVGIAPAMLLILGISLGIGLAHGLLITKLRLQPFLVTLCGLFIYRGIARTTVGDRSVGFGSEFGDLKAFLVREKLFGVIPMPFLILLLIAAAAAFLLNRTVYGRHLLALGRSEEAARFSGIAVDRVKIIAYMICSGLAGVGGMLFVLENNSGAPSVFGNFYELYAIAGAVLGGCSLRGGEGAIAGVICGTALVQVSSDAVFFLGVPEELKFTVIGSFILVGVILDEFLRRYGERRRMASRGG